MLRVNAACTVKTKDMQLSYHNGTLHSENDEPAIVFAVGTNVVDGVYLDYGVVPVPSDDALALSCKDVFALGRGLSYGRVPATHAAHVRRYAPITILPANSAPITILPANSAPKGTERRWYNKGDLHRAYGPAVLGERYWYNYCRGALAAAPGNTHTKAITQYGYKLCERCADNCVLLVACIESNLSWSNASLYRTCSGMILECPVQPDKLCSYFEANIWAAGERPGNCLPLRIIIP